MNSSPTGSDHQAGTNPGASSGGATAVGQSNTASHNGTVPSTAANAPAPVAVSSPATAAATTTNKPADSPVPAMPTDEAVMEYLKRKGLGTAALELSKVLKQKEEEESKEPQQSSPGSPSSEASPSKDSKAEEQKKNKIKVMRDRLDEEDSVFRNQRSLLTKVGGWLVPSGMNE
jgi:hypothetical protein